MDNREKLNLEENIQGKDTKPNSSRTVSTTDRLNKNAKPAEQEPSDHRLKQSDKRGDCKARKGTKNENTQF